ncbi:hypothetical protein [Nonomuraea typhae]|uniref:hypothetical protein n=1 Tax=Nonomuraea typhae TaxID=2603600 RepID=UPI0012FA7F4C|nr:hypothetical protein [Nonomuraea typhae]
MSIGNPALADVLARHGSPHRLLGALADSGVLVAVRPDRSVVLGTTQAGDRVLLGYTSPMTYARHRGSHSLSACDADTILDIQRVTGVREIVIDAAGPAAAAVPIDDLQRFLRTTRTGPTPVLSAAVPAAYATGAMATVSRGGDMFRPAPKTSPLMPETPVQPWIPAPRPHLSGPMQQVDPGYRRCTHPILPALRQAIAQLLADYPLVHHVWISEARTASGVPGIMLHVKVHMSAAEDVVRDLHRGARARLPQFAASGAPILMARVADARSEQRMVEIGAHVVCADVTD